MAIKVFQKGETDFAQANGYNTPTNPLINCNTNFTISSIEDDRLFTLIYPDDSTSSETFVEVGASSENTQRNNLQTTKGFRIKCYDSVTTEGVQLTGANYVSDYYYFVLIHSDDHLKHHFARVTDIITEDVAGDAFEFTPALGKEIPKDTKFMLFKGPIKTTTAIAFSAGIKNELQNSLVVSSPLFYLLDSSLNKKGELDHNTKYYARLNQTDGVTTTLDSASQNYVFLTEQEYSNKILDYSKYSMQLTLVDKLRERDDPSIHISNEGITINGPDADDYDEIFPNARRDSDDLISPVIQYVTKGPIRYLHYDYSPTKVNVLENVIDNKLEQSIGNRGGFCETKILNPSRILTSKIKEFDKYRVRHRVFTGDLNEFVDMKITLGSHISSRQYNIITDYSDARNFINVGDEVRIGTRILLCSAITTSTITFEEYSRLETESSFTNSTSLTSLTGTLQRRAYNYQDNTILTSFNLLAGRTSELYVKTMSKDMEFIESSVSSADATHGLITLSSNSQSYSSDSSLRYSLGSYHIEVERFSGTIEKIDSYKEDSQNYVELSGRSDISKLFGPIINKDTTFSEDIIYSTLSPYNTLANVKAGTTHSVALGATQIDTDIKISGLQTFDNDPSVIGTRIFSENGYIGEVIGISTHGASRRRLTITPSLTELNSEAIYMETDKNYIFSKALGSSHLTSANPTSLSGSAGKGVFFTSGKEITMSDGSEGNDLVGSSINTNPKAIGYHINSPVSINNDNEFQTKFVDEIGTEENSSFDTVNTLIDFEVVSTTKKNNVTEIELAPYVPITLGRKTHFYEDVSEMSFTSVGTIAQSIGNVDNLYFKMSTSNVHTLNKGDPLFFVPNETPNADKVFIGHVFQIVHTATTTNSNETYIQLDRTPEDLDTGDFIFLGTKPTNELALVNGAHLWGGKVLIKPHPKFISLNSINNLVPLNVESTTVSGDYFSRFGQPYYKITGISNGTFGLNLPLVTNASKIIRTPYEFKGKFSYLANTYNFKPKTSSNNITNAHTTSSSHRVLPLEERGLTSAFGSNFSDTRIHPTANRSILQLGFTEQRTKAALSFDSESSARLFIYVNGDILPYSSLRKDSLMCDSNKDINNYNLLLMENKKQKDSLFGGGDRLLLKDNNFQTVTFNTSQDISQLNRFGIMRLTEVCFDFFYNIINPEKPIPKTRNNDNYGISTLLGTSTSVGTISSIVDDVIEFTGSVSVSTDDYLYDDKGRLIGQLQSGTPISGNQYRLKADGYLTNNGSAATNCIKIVNTTIIKKGRNKKDTFARVDSVSLHPLKCCVIPKDSLYGDDSGDDAYSANGGASVTFQTSGAGNRDSEIVGPVAFDSNVLSNSNYNIGQFLVLQQMSNNESVGFYATVRGHNSIIGVSLDRFGIEDGGKYKLVEGNTTQLLLGDTAGAAVINSADYHATIGSLYAFKSLDNISASSRTFGGSKPYEADGTIMCFKPRLWIDADSSTGNYSVSDITSSAGTLKKVVIKTTKVTISGQRTFVNTFLKFIDLTGCYLVPEKGVNAQGDSITSGSYETRAGMNNSIPQNGTNNNELIHVISHEVSNSDSEEHHLICTAELEDETGYRILQPNETCFYEFMPKTIKFNFLSSEYTKKAYKDEVYDEIKESYFHKDGKLVNNNIYSDEAILSMFVIVDTDKQSTEEGLVLTSTDNFFSTKLPDGDYIMNFSDGEESEKISFTSKSNNKYESIELGKGINRQGIVSVSETFTVTSNDALQINPSRACIGTTVTIANETEELINELMEENDIAFDLETQDYPLYLAPNYQGVDLFSAINFLLEQKDLTLFEENDTFKIKNRLSNDFFKGIILNETGEYQIFDFEESKNMFNFYNQITVYGRNHKKVRKDIRSINDVGLKAFEVFNTELTTQEDVNKEASALLKLHSSSNKKLKITVGHSKISQIKVGDIINVEIPRENIPLSQFMVLQIEYLLAGLMVLELGKYSKGLEDRFADLIIQNKKINSQLRNESFKESESLDFLEELKINQIRLFARKRTSGGTFKLGFGTALNTGTTTLGYGVGTGITFTTLIDEELI